MREDENGQEFSDLRDIFRVLRSLQITRSLLTLKFRNDPRLYSSLLLHVDMDKRQFIIDEVTPDFGNQRLHGGEAFTIIAFYEGIQVTFKINRALSPSTPGFGNAFSMRFPTSIHHKQRREAYRAGVEVSMTSHVKLINEKRKSELEGRIVDLSTTGIGCEFPHFIRPEIKREELFQNCDIAIDHQFNLHCKLNAKHPRYEKSTGLYYCGFEFSHLDRINQKLLDRYVLNLQRHARKIGARRQAS